MTGYAQARADLLAAYRGPAPSHAGPRGACLPPDPTDQPQEPAMPTTTDDDTQPTITAHAHGPHVIDVPSGYTLTVRTAMPGTKPVLELRRPEAILTTPTPFTVRRLILRGGYRVTIG